MFKNSWKDKIVEILCGTHFGQQKNYLNICFIYHSHTENIFIVSCKWGPWVDPGCPQATCEPTNKTLTRSIEQYSQCYGLECASEESSKDEICPVLPDGKETIFISKFRHISD